MNFHKYHNCRNSTKFFKIIVTMRCIVLLILYRLGKNFFLKVKDIKVGL